MTLTKIILDTAIRPLLPATVPTLANATGCSTTTIRSRLNALRLLGRVTIGGQTATGADVYADTGKGWDAPELRCGACERLSPEARGHHPMRCLDRMGIVRAAEGWAPVDECGRAE